MDAKKKTGLAILLGLPKKDKDEETDTDTDEASPSYEDEGLEAASEEVLDAIKNEDAGALRDALKSFVTLCRDEDKEEE